MRTARRIASQIAITVDFAIECTDMPGATAGHRLAIVKRVTIACANRNIALSADVLRHRKDSDEMAGFSGQLAKPIDTDLLQAIFARFLPVAGAR